MERGADGLGQVYTIEWDGNRNPRSFMPTDLFEVWSYDGIVTPEKEFGNEIAHGKVSNLRMTIP